MKPEAHKSLMQPLSEAAKARSAIYSVLQAEPNAVFEISGIAKKLGIEYNVAYAAMKALSRKGLIGIRIIAPKKVRKKGKAKKTVRRAGRYINPWESKKRNNW